MTAATLASDPLVAAALQAVPPALAGDAFRFRDRRRPSSPDTVLGPALMQAIVQIVRCELHALIPGGPAAAPPSPWMTPPAAARVTRVPVKSIRAWARDGRIAKRLKNRSATPKQQKYLVNVEEVLAAANRLDRAGPAAAEPADVRERAREILAARAAKGR